MPFDPILKWKKSPSLDAAKYTVAWTRNGEPAGAGDLAKTASGDVYGYSAKFSQHNPGVAVGDGDAIGASVRCVDASGLASAAVESSVAVPSEPPEPPEAVTLTLS